MRRMLMQHQRNLSIIMRHIESGALWRNMLLMNQETAIELAIIFVSGGEGLSAFQQIQVYMLMFVPHYT